MASWKEIEAAAPELAGRARAAFDAHKHKLLATLRRDGSPRISGIEATFEKRLYDPLKDWIFGLSRRMRAIQAGSIHAYLAYIFVTLILLLLFGVRQ